MNTKLIIGAIVVILVMFGIITAQQSEIERVKADRDIYKSNTDVANTQIEHYKTSDSLNAVKIKQQTFTIGELKRYRAEDQETIESLKLDKKRLASVTTAETNTVYNITGAVHDSIIYRDNFITDTLHCLTYHDAWVDINGCADKNDLATVEITSRDSLLYVEHITPHKFLFIKWGQKSREQEMVSKNPNTQIINAEFITVRK